MGLFGKDPKADPKEQVREWQKKLRGEMRQLDRQIHGIQREEEKCKRTIKDAAKKGNMEAAKLMAKELINSRKAIGKIHTSKAQINSVVLSMQQQASTVRLAGSLQASTEVMRSMQSLIKVPEIAATMQEMSKEMMKAGIIEEMIEDTLEGMEPEDLEEQADAEVERILWEVTKGELGRAPAAPSDSLAASIAPQEPAAEDMESRLEALRS